MDGIDLGPERRAYLDHALERVWEVNMQGGIPWVPYLRAPCFVWLGRKRSGGVVAHEAKVEAPAMFPPTFLYSQSWEDPEPDMKARLTPDPSRVQAGLLSGGLTAGCARRCSSCATRTCA